MNFSYMDKFWESTNAVGEMINEYKGKYAEQIITAGKELAEGVKADTRVIFEDVVAMGQRSDPKTEKTGKADTDAKTDGQEKSTVEKEPESEQQFCLRRAIKEKAQQIASTFDQYKDKYAANTTKNAELFIDAVKTDTRKVVDDVSGNAKKIVTQRIRLKGIQNTFLRSVDGVLSRINIPQKQDIERLTQALETLNTKVDYLNNKHTV